MVQIIPDKFKKLWNEWDLRVLILVSLSLQAFLILFVTFRKTRASKWISMSIWSAYLLADWVAAVSVGLISNSQADRSSGHYDENGDLLALWAPFLLLHLGGPDTITSFSQEDNELWVRHLFGVILQVGAAIYVFLQSLPKNNLWIPTILVLIAGTIKYAERTRALYLASMENFGNSAKGKPNPGPEYERVQQMFNAMKQAHVPAHMHVLKGPNKELRDIKYKNLKELKGLDDKSLLRFAFGFFETFKGLIPGLLVSSQERQASRDFFLNRTANDAFKLIEVELSLVYEVLHTKVVVVQCWAGYIFRFISSVSVPMAFLLFGLAHKQSFRKFDVRLTYVLFIGALILESISLIELMFLDRTVSSLENWWGKFIAPKIINNRRWSKSFYQCDFMKYCLKDFPKWTNNLAQLFWDGSWFDNLKIMRLLSSNDFDENLKKFIFEELREKSLIADNPSEIGKICSSKGGWALQRFYAEKLKRSVPDELDRSVQEVEYAESLLLWHIATELVCNASSSSEKNDDKNSTELLCNASSSSEKNDDKNSKEYSKLLSEYAFYLVLMQTTIMAPVSGNWQMIFQDTCAEAKRFFHNNNCSEYSEARAEILKFSPEIKPGAVKGDVSKSVWFDACILAKELSKLKERKWELMSKVWLEMLCYAAVHCRASVHAQQPSKGGELLTIIWLLMNHLGLGIQFYEANAARIKIIVRK